MMINTRGTLVSFDLRGAIVVESSAITASWCTYFVRAKAMLRGFRRAISYGTVDNSDDVRRKYSNLVYNYKKPNFVVVFGVHFQPNCS